MGYGVFPVRRERPARQNPTDCYAGIRGDLCLATFRRKIRVALGAGTVSPISRLQRINNLRAHSEAKLADSTQPPRSFSFLRRKVTNFFTVGEPGGRGWSPRHFFTPSHGSFCPPEATDSIKITKQTQLTNKSSDSNHLGGISEGQEKASL